MPGEAGTTMPMVHYARCARQAASTPSLAGTKLLLFGGVRLVTGPVVWCCDEGSRGAT